MHVLRLIPVFIVCVFLTGGQYGMMQCVAWAGMWWSYSEKGGWLEGAQKTFDGEHPCCLCKAIAEAKEQKPDPKQPLIKADPVKLKELQCPQLLGLNPPRAVDLAGVRFAAPGKSLSQWVTGPLSPPPRAQA